MKWLVAVIFALQVQAPQVQAPRDDDGHPASEHQIPAGHYCQRTKVYEENARRLAARGRKPESAHPCDCTYTCHVDANGSLSETGGEKSTGCKSFCEKDGRRCTCHVEEPCDLGQGSARFDMNHKMVAMSRSR